MRILISIYYVLVIEQFQLVELNKSQLVELNKSVFRNEVSLRIMKVSELIYQENGFVVKLHCENEFDADEYNKIKELLKIKVIEWKKTGYVPNDEVVAIMSLVDQLVGGSHFFDEKTVIKVEDASLEIQDILTDLIR